MADCRKQRDNGCVSFQIPILIYRQNSVVINDDGWCLGNRQCLFMETVVCVHCLVAHCERFEALENLRD